MQKPELPAPNQIQKIGLTDFVGAVTDGLYGTVAFDFKSPHDPLIARKAWFFFDDEYVCLGAGIRCLNGQAVATSLNQCLLQGEVTVGDSRGVYRLPRGEHQLNNVHWVHHAGNAYVFPASCALTVRCDAQTGTWSSINDPLSDTPVTKGVFCAWINHGKQVADGNYAYVVAPAMEESRITAYATALPVILLANHAELQAVVHSELRRAELVFYVPGSCDIPGFGEVRVDRPCAVMVAWQDREMSLSVSNPEHQGLSLEVSVPGCWGGAEVQVKDGRAAVQFLLPGNSEQAGSTATVHLRRVCTCV